MMKRIPAATLALFAWSLQAEVIDRIAVTVGRHVITQSQLDTEVRVTAFLEGQKVENPELARKQAATRLIQQTLIRREIELTRSPAPNAEEAAPLLEQARALRGATFNKDLAEAGLLTSDLAEHLLWQLTFLRFVQYRFQPSINLADDEVKAYYGEQLARWAKEGKSAPPMESIRKEIETVLTQRHVDEALDRWLLEQQQQTTIVYRIKGLTE